MRILGYLIVVSLITLSTSCKKETLENSEWIIPENEVKDGGPGKDGIPSIDNHKFTPISETNFLNDESLLVGVLDGGELKLYPHFVLDWHEIVNDAVGSEKIAVVYCPLTGTATVWDRLVDGTETTFGVSGLLYNSNIIPYDRKTNSNWSQILQKSVNGPLVSDKTTNLQGVETTFATWKSMFPEALVMTSNTGFERSYGTYPYGDYITNNEKLLYPVTPDDTRLPRKERVFAILNTGSQKLYRFSSFSQGVQTITDGNFVVTGSASNNFIVAFKKEAGKTYESVQDKYPVIMLDSQGSEWNIFGIAVSGPQEGQRLIAANSFIGYAFSFSAFYPGISIYDI